MEKILTLLGDNGGSIALIILGLSIFIEITPIKISPITACLKWIADGLNKETKEQLKIISSQLINVCGQINGLSGRIDILEINDIRSKILNFSNSCMTNNHTKEEFEHIINLYSSYEEIINKMGIKNGCIELAYSYISDLYTQNLKNNTFMKN